MIDKISIVHAFQVDKLQPTNGLWERPERVKQRQAFLKEEWQEMLDEITNKDIVNLVKESCDVLYIAAGTIVESGIYTTSEGALGSDLPKNHFGFMQHCYDNFVNMTELHSVQSRTFAWLDYAVRTYLHKIWDISPETLDKAFVLVHQNNMLKEAVTNGNGKIIKRPNHPDVKIELVKLLEYGN
jgi:hypothetical protein